MTSDTGYGQFFIIHPDKSKAGFVIPSPVLTVGRDPKNGLVLSHPAVTPFHCRFEWRQGQAVIVDISGGAGIQVNSTPVREQMLRQGDVVRVGEFFLVYHAAASTVAGAGASGGRGAAPPPQGMPRVPGPGFPHAPPLAPGGPVGGSAGHPAPPPVGGSGGRPVQPAPPVGGSGARLAPPAIPGGGSHGHPPAPPSGSGTSPIAIPTVARGMGQQSLQGGVALRIGRDPSNNVSLNHLQVSRFHAEITNQGGAYAIRDLGSTNGTFVNGQRITQSPLKRGDQIKISDYNFYFDGQRLEQFSEEGNARIDAINLRRVVTGGQVILQDISLSIYPREFVAVVGVSGAGKSTLVSALSGFRPADQGLVLFNGLDYYANLESFRSTLGYVPQDDIIHPELTSYRALHYAAQLRMPEDTSPQEREKRIQEVLADLQLTERAHVPIHRLSGGQRKRVSIGVELLTKPRLFYLDEPTSGLDPGMEAEMMRIFRHLADQGHTLILITHATRNIMLCDKIVFLARGGYLAFYGSPQEALDYFGATDFADIYLKVEHEKSPQQWDMEYKRSPHYQRYVVQRLQEVNALVARARANPGASMPAAAQVPGKQGSPFRQFGILVRRYVDILSRDRINMSILLAQAPVLSLILLLTVFNNPGFLNASPGTEVFGKAKILMFLLTFFSLMCGCINAVREICKENPIYKRERTVNLRILPYVLSKVGVLASISALQTLIFVGITFYVVEPRSGVESFHAEVFLSLFFVNLAGVALGLAVSAGVNNQNTAVTTLPIVLLTQIVLSGILQAFEDKLKLITNLTAVKWGFGMLGHVAQVTRLWPASPPNVPNPPKPPEPSLYDITLLPSDDTIGGLVPLVFFVLLFLGAACAFQRAKDTVRD